MWADAAKTQYRSLKDYLHDIADIFDEMSPENQTKLLDSLFGKRGASVGSAILRNIDQVDKALVEMENAAGSADREMGIIRDSIDYHINELKQTWIGTWQEILDRGDINTAIDLLTKLSEAIGFLVDKAGLLGSLSFVGEGLLMKNGLGLTVVYKPPIVRLCNNAA